LTDAPTEIGKSLGQACCTAEVLAVAGLNRREVVRLGWAAVNGVYNPCAMPQMWGPGMKRWLTRLFIAALPLGLVIVGARGDSADNADSADTLTLEEYFERLDAVLEAGDGEVETLDAQFVETSDAAQTDEESHDAFRNYFAGTEEVFQQVISGLESIEPPPTVKEAHDEYVAIEVEALDFFLANIEPAERTSSLLEILEELQGPAAEEIIARKAEGCLALQAIADDSGITMDLECLG
jgi:hypothetical protein